MGFREFLIGKGLTEEQADGIIAGMNESKIYLSAEERIDERYAALKLKLEETEGDLVSANELVETLRDENKDNEELQTKVTNYENQIKQLEDERMQERGVSVLREALIAKGAVDVDYAIYKLGELEYSEDGTIKDLDNKIKDLVENNPTQFKTEDNPKGQQAPGYIVEDNKLNGTDTPPQTFDLSKMSVEEINANWEAIQEQENNK